MSKLLKRLLMPLLNATLHPLSGLIPRSDRRWVFGHSGEKFAGNPKYLFLWMTLNRPDIQVTWITSSVAVRHLLLQNGYRVRSRWSAAGVIAVLRARVFVFAHGVGNVNTLLSGGALLLNLWHGVGLKAVHLGHGVGKTAQARKKAATSLLARLGGLQYLKPYDILVTTSDMMQAHFSAQFELPRNHCPQLGYPRLDCASDEVLASLVRQMDAKAGFRLNPGGFDEIYLYMPTYRDTGRPFVAEALPDLERLSAVLAGRNALFYIKLHPDTHERLPELPENIRVWPDAIDVNAYLADCTGLITDYSSVLYDYLFVRPTGAILYTYDFERYTSADRSLLYPYDENVAGLRVSTFTELCDALQSGASFDVSLQADIERIRDRFWGGSMRPASRAVVEYVERQLAAAPCPRSGSPA